jgi:toxin secretion/phage lysis holin
MKRITEVLAAIGGAIASFFCGLPPVMWVLIAVMSIDYITGILCGIMGKSQKTENGYLASHAAFMGLLKKALIILVVLLAALLDKAVSMGAGIEFEAVTGATCLWFIASEGFSILENVACMGVPVPKILMKMLEVMKSKGDAQEEKKEEKQDEREESDDKQ